MSASLTVCVSLSHPPFLFSLLSRCSSPSQKGESPKERPANDASPAKSCGHHGLLIGLFLSAGYPLSISSTD